MAAAGETLGIGVIGAGLISAYHIAGIQAAGGATVRVLAARTPGRAGPLARRFGVREVTTNWRAVLERADVDAVVIATPDVMHREMALAAAETGKAILLQKPMACLRPSAARSSPRRGPPGLTSRSAGCTATSRKSCARASCWRRAGSARCTRCASATQRQGRTSPGSSTARGWPEAWWCSWGFTASTCSGICRGDRESHRHDGHDLPGAGFRRWPPGEQRARG
jgi:hypothetical protein